MKSIRNYYLRIFFVYINRLVKEGKAPTPKACQQKEHEVKSAFAETGKERK